MAALLWLSGPHQAGAVETVTPPGIYPPDTWEGRGVAVVRVLDKLDAQTRSFSIAAGQSVTYKSLKIDVRNCLQHPRGLPPDAAAFLSIRDAQSGAKPFGDWMFATEPFLEVFESPVYGVQLIGCDGADVPPLAPPLPPPPAAPDVITPPGLSAPPLHPPPTPGN